MPPPTKKKSPAAHPAPTDGRVPPHDVDLEKDTLSTLFRDRVAVLKVRPVLKPEHLFAEDHAIIYEAMLNVADDNQPVSLSTVRSKLRAMGMLDRVGGVEYLTQLTASRPEVKDVLAFVDRIFALHKLRTIKTKCLEIAASVNDATEDVAGFAEQANRDISTIVYSGRTDTSQLQHVGTSVDAAMHGVKNRHDSEITSGIATGYRELDELTGGIHEGDVWCIAGRPGQGKAQPIDAKIMTPDGWRRMGDLAVGDYVTGSNGLPCKVLGVFEQGERDVFRVQMVDGGSTECCDEHLWFTRTRSERRRGLGGSVRTLREIRSTLLRADGGRNHSVPLHGPVHFAEAKDPLPVDPYLLGLYLGDGCSRSGSVGIDNPERDIRARIIKISNDRVVERPDGLHLAFTQKDEKPCELRLALKRLGLFDIKSPERFVPEMYLRRSIQERLELLRGLLDTDGHVPDEGTAVEYSTTSERLLNDVTFLVHSLGGQIRTTSKLAHYTRNGERHYTRIAYRSWIRFHSGEIVPVSSRKHLAIWKTSKRRVCERFIESVTAAGRKRCRCIAVDAPDRLYITDDGIVTHNTSALLGILGKITQPWEKDKEPPIEVPEIGAAFFSLEMPREQIVNRLLCMDAKISFTRWRSGELLNHEWGPAYASAERIQASRLWIDETPNISLAEAEAKLVTLKSEWDREPTFAGCPRCTRPLFYQAEIARWYCPACHPDPRSADAMLYERRQQLTRARIIGAVGYDFFGLMKPEPARSREEEMGGISRGLKTVSKRRKVGSLVAAQLNREVEKRNPKDKRPQLSDLRETGSLEQDSDLVMLLYREAYYQPENEKVRGKGEWNVAKQRNGKTGTIKMRYEASHSSFYDEDDPYGKARAYSLPSAPARVAFQPTDPVTTDDDLPPGL